MSVLLIWNLICKGIYIYQLHFKMYSKCQGGPEYFIYLFKFFRNQKRKLAFWLVFSSNFWKASIFVWPLALKCRNYRGSHFVSNIWQRNSSCYKPTCFKQTRKNRCFRKLSVIEYLTLQWLQDIFSSGPQSIRLLSDIIVFQMKMWFDLIDFFLFNVYIVLELNLVYFIIYVLFYYRVSNLIYIF